MNILPKDLFNEVPKYWNPWKVVHQQKQKKINKFFDTVRKVKNQGLVTIRYWWPEKEKKEILYPTVSEMKRGVLKFNTLRYRYLHSSKSKRKYCNLSVWCDDDSIISFWSKLESLFELSPPKKEISTRKKEFVI